MASEGGSAGLIRGAVHAVIDDGVNRGIGFLLLVVLHRVGEDGGEPGG